MNKKINKIFSTGLVLAAGILSLSSSISQAAVGDKINLKDTVKVYYTAGDAKSGVNSVNTYGKGTYYVYSENARTGMVNITRRMGNPGGWVDPNEFDGKESTKPSKPSIPSNGGKIEIDSPVSVYYTASDAKEEKNSVNIYGRGSYYIYSKNARTGMINISRRLGSPGGWINPDSIGKSIVVEDKETSSKPTAPSKPQSSKQYPLPSGSYYVSSEYGYRIHPISGYQNLHGGIDLAAPAGTSIYSVKPGTVTISAYHYSYGNYVKVRHNDGTETLYAHMSQRNAYVGQKVSAGTVIGYVGTTGDSTGNHLHFELWSGGVRVNPRNEYNF